MHCKQAPVVVCCSKSAGVTLIDGWAPRWWWSPYLLDLPLVIGSSVIEVVAEAADQQGKALHVSQHVVHVSSLKSPQARQNVNIAN